jgi:hypothetical protein
MTEYVSQIYHEGKYTMCQVDAAFTGLIKDLTSGSTKTGRKPINAVPLAFGEKLESMTANAPMKIQNDEVRIHPAFHELLSQLKAIEYDDRGRPDKKKLKFDMGDAFLMGLDYWGTRIIARKLKGDY